MFKITNFIPINSGILALVYEGTYNNEKVAIKIDVERHELNVLEGLNNLLKHNDIILQIELFEDRRDSIIKYLEERDFKHINTIQRDFYFKNF